MRASSLFGPATAGFASVLRLSSVLPLFQSTVYGFSFDPVPAPNLELSQLGRVVFTGDFDAVSLYSYEAQSETSVIDNDSQSILTALPNGQLTSLSESDAYILAMCPFMKKDGAFGGIFVGGNFTSLGDTETTGAALFHPNSSKVTPLPGLKGSVSALLCDHETSTVYVGGDFKHGNNSNAVSWVDGEGWKNLPFQGLNGPVTSIEKDVNGHIVFAGAFDGLGDKKSSSSSSSTPFKKRKQLVNLQSAEISSSAISHLDGFSDPRNIICPASAEAGKGTTWLLEDYSPGFWRADMGFNFQPSKLRLYNTHLNGRGTKSFLFRALPINGIMNFTYSDPDAGNDVYCDASCPLSSDPNEEYRDFHFVNNVGMNGFMVEVQDWYGQGAGLNGIELFQNGKCACSVLYKSAILTGTDTSAYANNDFNEPSCANLQTPSKAAHTGSWSTTEAGYLISHVTDADATRPSVTFKPYVKRPGKYSIKIYTPGCLNDGSCDSRGIVNVTATVATGTESAAPIQTFIAQTNLHDKYDPIYTGHVDASSDSFRPRVNLTPKPGQGKITVVASRVSFDQISTDETGGGLNGLYDYGPSSKKTDADLKESAINRAGLRMGHDSVMMSLAEHDGVLYAGGNFSDADIHNIMSIEGNATAMPEGGVNSEVKAMAVLDDFLYVGGNFTDTANGGNDDLKHIAAYPFGSETWSALGAGVNGPVRTVFSLPLNVSRDINETVVAVSGDFDQIRAFGNNPSIPVSGFAVWIPSQKNWLQNLDYTQIQFAGQLSASSKFNDTVILAGSLVSNGISVGAAVSLLYGDEFTLEPLMTTVDRSSDGKGTFTGVYDTNSGRNLTIVGGHFSATLSEGSTVENLAILDGSENTITGFGKGVDSNSTFLAMDVSGDTLFAGGNVTGAVGESRLNGYVAYDLSSGKFVQNQPPPLTGGNVVVNSISARPESPEVFFGGRFDAADYLPCPTVCFYDTSEKSWNRPGASIGGTVLDLAWSSHNDLFAVGDLNVEGNETAAATYNTKKQSWKAFEGASKLPGPVTAFTPASTDVSRFWLAGESANGSTFLVHYDGSDFRSAGSIFGDGTTIRGLEALPLSKNHEDSELLKNDLSLLVTGQLVVPGFGNASAALFNGTGLTPFVLSSKYNGQPGSMSQIISEKQNPYSRQCKCSPWSIR